MRSDREKSAGTQEPSITAELVRVAREHGVPVGEVMDLAGSEVACAIADQWARVTRAFPRLLDGFPSLAELLPLLNRLESITRPSKLRKIR